MKKQLIIVGAGGHGRVVADIARLSGYQKIAFLDDCGSLTTVSGKYPILGNVEQAVEYKNDAEFVVAIGNGKLREKIMRQIASFGGVCASLVHPNATIGENVLIGEGTVVMAGAVINPSATIGKGVIVNTCASVDHDCVVHDFCHIAVGAHLCGNVILGENTWIGAGATVINNVEICSACVVGAGAVVIKKIDKCGTYIGVPAKEKK